MSSRIPLRGGSAGEPPKTSSLPYFYSEIKAVELITKNTYGIRLLPSFQYDYNTMVPVSPLSVIPYRNPEQVDPETQRPVFTDWYFPLKVHKWVGNRGRGFTSPLLEHQFDAKDVDPLHNIYLTAKNSDNPDWRHLTEKEKDEMSAALRKYRVAYAMNALCAGQNNQMENRIIVVSAESLNLLKKKLNLRAGRSDAVLDPNWPDYVFGDVTSPQFGLYASVKASVFNDASMKCSTFYFGGMTPDEQPIGVQTYKIDENTAWGQEVLSKRQNIPDTKTVTRIHTAEEILDYLVDDGFIPYELIQRACGHCWNIPPFQPQRVHVPAPANTNSVAGTGLAPTPNMAPPAPGATPAPAAGPAPGQALYWASVGGQAQGPFNALQILGMVTQQGQDLMICPQNGTTAADWKPASQYGIVNRPQPAPVPPTPPAPARTAPPPPPGMAPPAPGPAPAAAPVPMQPRTVAPPGPPMTAPQPAIPPRPTGPPAAPISRPSPAIPPAGAPPAMPAAAAPAAPPMAPTAPLAPVAAPAQPAAAVPAPLPLTAEEQNEYQALWNKWQTNGAAGLECLTPAEVSRFAELGDRLSAVNAAAAG